MNAAEIACALGDARRPGRVWRCLCPLHGGHSLLQATTVKFNLTMAAYNLVAQVAQLTRITGRRHPMGSIPAKLAITNSSSLGLNHITASLARIFNNLLPN